MSYLVLGFASAVVVLAQVELLVDDTDLMQMQRVNQHLQPKEDSVNSLLEKFESMAISRVENGTVFSDEVIRGLEGIKAHLQSILAEIPKAHSADGNILSADIAAIQQCETERQNAFAKPSGVTYLEGSVTDKRSSHKNCRSTEVDLKATRNTRCGDLRTYLDSSQLPACAIGLTSAATGRDSASLLPCANSLQIWSANFKSNLNEKHKACEDAKAAHASKSQECNSLQAGFEQGFCLYNLDLNTACDALDTCREDRIAVFSKHLENVKVAAKARKAEHVAVLKTTCYIELLLNKETELGTKLTECKNLNPSVDSLKIIEPATPSKVPCDVSPVEHSPCDDRWMEVEYTSSEWHKEAPVNVCVPCPQDSAHATNSVTFGKCESVEYVGSGFCGDANHKWLRNVASHKRLGSESECKKACIDAVWTVEDAGESGIADKAEVGCAGLTWEGGKCRLHTPPGVVSVSNSADWILDTNFDVGGPIVKAMKYGDYTCFKCTANAT